MKKSIPYIKIAPNLKYVKERAIRLSEKTLKKKDQANNFLTDIADAFIFVSTSIRNMFSRDFEFREFLQQCFQIGNKSLAF